MPVVIGLDVGTSGARAVAAREDGSVIHTATASLPPPFSPQPGWSEQDPEDWWKVSVEVLQEVGRHLPADEPVLGLAVDSTSGTILPVDARGEPLGPALLYNDGRASREAEELNNQGSPLCATMGYRFNSSYALAKILWIRRHRPEDYARAHRFIHAADFLIGRLTGRFDVTDTSNVLKTGYDLVHHRWPDFLDQVDLTKDKLPEVVRSGAVIEIVLDTVADSLGLPHGIQAIAGASDGTAGFLSSGAVRPGEFNSTLGTTLVVKGVSEKIFVDPLGRVYSHVHPTGYWLPGGASNVGGEWIQRRFNGADLAALDHQASQHFPASLLVYPLVRKGERFPFVKPDAEGFETGGAVDEAERFAAHLEGVAFVERWIYELITELGCPVGSRIYCTGGGSRSDVWMQLRADVLGRVMIRPQQSEAAFGMAVLAASAAVYQGDLAEATGRMVRIAQEFQPSSRLKSQWNDKYARFRAACREKGYV